MRKIFVSDYDGTITNKDIYALLAERYVPADTPDYFTQYVEGPITHSAAINPRCGVTVPPDSRYSVDSAP